MPAGKRASANSMSIERLHLLGRFGAPQCYGHCQRSVSGGRTWWAYLEFTPINIELTILPKKIEELHTARSSRTPTETRSVNYS
jgi:hypothetical protein